MMYWRIRRVMNPEDKQILLADSSAPANPLDDDNALTPVVEPFPEKIASWGLPFYLFVEPLCASRVVVDLSPMQSPGPDLLKRAGAVEVLRGDPKVLPLPFPSAGADMVLAGLSHASAMDDQLRFLVISEVRRLLRPGGFAVVRVAADSMVKSNASVSLRAMLADLLLQHFAIVEIVEETPFRGESFFAPGCDELAVSEAMARLAGNPSYLIALCSDAPERPWHLSESLLVPTHTGEGDNPSDGELDIWRGEVARISRLLLEATRERDGLREQRMTLQDRVERLGKMVASLRKDVERYLRQGSEAAGTHELVQIERDQLRRKQSASDAEIDRLALQLEEQSSSVRALEKEVARLRAARGEAQTQPAR